MKRSMEKHGGIESDSKKFSLKSFWGIAFAVIIALTSTFGFIHKYMIIPDKVEELEIEHVKEDVVDIKYDIADLVNAIKEQTKATQENTMSNKEMIIHIENIYKDVEEIKENVKTLENRLDSHIREDVGDTGKTMYADKEDCFAVFVKEDLDWGEYGIERHR